MLSFHLKDEALHLWWLPFHFKDVAFGVGMYYAAFQKCAISSFIAYDGTKRCCIWGREVLCCIAKLRHSIFYCFHFI